MFMRRVSPIDAAMIPPYFIGLAWALQLSYSRRTALATQMQVLAEGLTFQAIVIHPRSEADKTVAFIGANIESSQIPGMGFALYWIRCLSTPLLRKFCASRAKRLRTFGLSSVPPTV